MPRAALTFLFLIPLMACRSGGADVTMPAQMSEPERIMAAGRANVRAAYTLYTLALFDLQLAFLETLPRGWFLGTAELEEAAAQLAQITDREAAPADLNDPAAFSRHARHWLEWWRLRRDSIHQTRREQWDPLFARLEATTPFLESEEFRGIVRSLGELSGREPSWGRGERYPSWDAFAADRTGWRAWFEANRDRLEYDNLSGQLVIGRGLGEHSHE